MTEETLNQIVDQVADRCRLEELNYGNGLIACRLLQRELKEQNLDVKIVHAPVQVSVASMSGRAITDHEDQDHVIALVDFYGKVIMVDFTLGQFVRGFPVCLGYHPVTGETQVFLHDGITVGAAYKPDYKSKTQAYEDWLDWTADLDLLLMGLDQYDPDKAPADAFDKPSV